MRAKNHDLWLCLFHIFRYSYGIGIDHFTQNQYPFTEAPTLCLLFLYLHLELRSRSASSC